MEQLAADGYQLEAHGLGFDELFVDGGECTAALAGVPTLELLSERWDLRASGEVKNCPYEKSPATVSVQVSATDSTSWTSTSTSAELNLIVAKIMSGGALREFTHEIQEVTTISKQIEAGWCLRVPYEAYLRTAEYQLTVPVRLRRHYAWWTKSATGLLDWSSEVHLQGLVSVDCGVVDVVFRRRAALEFRFRTNYYRCNDPVCDVVTTPPAEWSPPMPLPAPRPVTPAPTEGGDGGTAPVPDPEGTPAPEEDPSAAEDEAPPDEEPEGDAEDGPPQNQSPESNEPDQQEPASQPDGAANPDGSNQEPEPAPSNG